LTNLFIKRPVATTLVMVAILLFGFLGYRNLPVSDLPNVDFPTILVTTVLPGSSPKTMASAVATPLEKQFTTIAGIASMSSVSSLGMTQITVQFDLSRNIDAAAQDIQAAISKVQPQLPHELPAPPAYQKVNPADQPIIYMALNSPTLPLSRVDEFAQTYVAQRISTVNGVAQVQVFGSQKYAVRVQVNPDSLASKGIGIDEVAAAIGAGNPNLPTGVLQGRDRGFTVDASGQLGDAAGFRSLIVTWRNGAPVRLSDLGRVIDSVENDRIAAWYNGNRGIVLAVQRQPGTNTVEVVDSIRKLLPVFRNEMPAGMALSILYDRSESIRASVGDVKFTLVLSVALVIMVIFLFLRNLSATLIPSLAVPLSLVATFGVLYLLGYSVDNFSLMALTLSVGFVVDDAIVMLENVVRHMEMGKPRLQAALDGAREIGFTILSMTASLAAVFLPVFFLGGVPGRLLHEFAVTTISAILVSGFVSLSLTPMLAGRFLRPSTEAHRSRLYLASERVFDGMLSAYRWSLTRVLRHRFAVLMVALAILGATVWLFTVTPTGFLPDEDTGQLVVSTDAAQGISFDAMREHQLRIARIVWNDPAVEGANCSIGVGGPNIAMNGGRCFMALKPRAARVGAVEVLQRLRAKMAQVPGIKSFLQIPPLIRIGGQVTKSAYQLTIQNPDADALYRDTPRLEAAMRNIDLLQDVTSDLQLADPHLVVDIGRDRASAMGITAGQIEDALFSAYGTRQVSTIYTSNNEYEVILELLPEYRDQPQDLSRLYVRSPSGTLARLDTVARLGHGVGPVLVTHLGQLPSVTISFNLRPGAFLGPALAEVDRVTRATLPDGFTTSFQGTAQAFQSSLAGMGLLFLMAIAVIYIVLGILYESFLHPITILSGLPSAAFGALLALRIFHIDLNLYAMVGVLLLVGIVKKNAIMQIDFALDAERREGKSPAEAIFEGCLIRFRPIMMTTMAALVGTLPIAIGIGAGAESRRGMGVAVVGGLLFSQLLTLYVTPVVYTYLDALAGRVKGRPAASPAAPDSALPMDDTRPR
jgi:hydrophobic/amphiphilic exporter-1 (mainly G- bacteria), HAE1 family